jgi:hypothetical protein
MQMLRERHVPGVAARTASVTDEIAGLPITEHFICNSRS